MWDGSMERLRAEAPAPAHRLWTSDDRRAMEIAAAQPGVGVVSGPGGLAHGGARTATRSTPTSSRSAGRASPSGGWSC